MGLPSSRYPGSPKHRSLAVLPNGIRRTNSARLLATETSRAPPRGPDLQPLSVAAGCRHPAVGWLPATSPLGSSSCVVDAAYVYKPRLYSTPSGLTSCEGLQPRPDEGRGVRGRGMFSKHYG